MIDEKTRTRLELVLDAWLEEYVTTLLCTSGGEPPRAIGGMREYFSKRQVVDNLGRVFDERERPIIDALKAQLAAQRLEIERLKAANKERHETVVAQMDKNWDLHP